MVATTPSREVAYDISAASGEGSCLGAIIACFRYTSNEPP
jgi:hypothetical protein